MSKENPSLGEKHYTSTVFVLTEEVPKRVLLIYHKKMATWLPPGGHQETSENSIEAAIRETKEETNVDIEPYLPKPQPLDERAVALPLPRYILEERIPARGDHPEHFHLDMIYVVFVPYQAVIHEQAESDSIGWFTETEVKDLPIFENVATILNGLFSS